MLLILDILTRPIALGLAVDMLVAIVSGQDPHGQGTLRIDTAGDRLGVRVRARRGVRRPGVHWSGPLRARSISRPLKPGEGRGLEGTTVEDDGAGSPR